MVSTELGTAILGADTALYGFVIAYYAFARSLIEQERTRISAQPPEPGAPIGRNPRFLRAWMKLYSRAGWVDLFLLGCTALATPSMVLGLLFLLGTGLPEITGPGEFVFFVLFLVAVASWMVLVGWLNFRQNWIDYREQPAGPEKAHGIWGFLMQGLQRK